LKFIFLVQKLFSSAKSINFDCAFLLSKPVNSHEFISIQRLVNAFSDISQPETDSMISKSYFLAKAKSLTS
jgi:hypothetical protein